VGLNIKSRQNKNNGTKYENEKNKGNTDEVTTVKLLGDLNIWGTVINNTNDYLQSFKNPAFT
jgi:hypothetical protein